MLRGPIEVHVPAAPTEYAAYQSHPNPFNPVCTIGLILSRSCGIIILLNQANLLAVTPQRAILSARLPR